MNKHIIYKLRKEVSDMRSSIKILRKLLNDRRDDLNDAGCMNCDKFLSTIICDTNIACTLLSNAIISTELLFFFFFSDVSN